MKIVIIGGSGLIGSKLVYKLRQLDHEVIAASPASGVNTVTGEGLDEALKGTQVVVDVANSPSFEEKAVMEFFETSGRNLLKAAAANGVRHHIALSVVGTERLQQSGYFRAKLAQERLIKASGIPYTILHSTQFFEFAHSIAQAGTVGDEVHISPAAIQPIASDEVVDALTGIALGAPRNGTVEVAGPVRMPMDEFIRFYLSSTEDSRQLVTDERALYFGSTLNDATLVSDEVFLLGKVKYEDWFRAQPY
ncbi:SDR family oxidoreductase [Pseudoflavitalea sp. X16]|uniref:SDR family oxidoreductase n=1 Tax=Paraflavitalea devenefica TaxID=2716334 RepID=UPI001421AC0E|nr:SDR family oxidoreductase [Paraflavitalea devenefica]NII29334.1 SDR family oxidoreductase [Paraflavitalea devenefica]